MRYLILYSVAFLFPFFINAQEGRKITREEYIEIYKELAIREMEHSGIPASITLAQGMHESGNGNSSLARKANNHFGIKCHDWKGKSIFQDDDDKNECFRKYKSVEESYRDHSDFLTGRSRYAVLFELKSDDYIAWAKGLKEVGYATNPNYAKALIKIIEDNKLYAFDKPVLAQKNLKNGRRPEHKNAEYAGGRKVLYNNRVKYILARQGDNFYSISEELDLLDWQLPKYNDMPENTVFSEGQFVYLQPKRNKADVQCKVHIVKQGETFFDISQLYAIKANKLAARNGYKPGSEPLTGQELLLRKRKKGTAQLSAPKIEINEKEEKEEFKVDFK